MVVYSIHDDLSNKHLEAMSETVEKDVSFPVSTQKPNSPPKHWRRKHILVLAKERNVYKAISPD